MATYTHDISWLTVGKSSKASLLASPRIVQFLEQEHIFDETTKNCMPHLLIACMHSCHKPGITRVSGFGLLPALISPLGSNALWVVPESETTCKAHHREAWLRNSGCNFNMIPLSVYFVYIYISNYIYTYIYIYYIVNFTVATDACFSAHDGARKGWISCQKARSDMHQSWQEMCNRQVMFGQWCSRQAGFTAPGKVFLTKLSVLDLPSIMPMSFAVTQSRSKRSRFFCDAKDTFREKPL